MTEPGRRRVVVIGGGITGLAAARDLVVGGADVILVEKETELGGKVQTEKIDGFVVEDGPDSFVSAKQHVLDLISELGITGEVISSNPANQGSFVYSRERLHRMPDGLLLMAPSRLLPVLRSPLLSWRGRLRLLGDLLGPRGGKDDESLASFVNRRLGSEVLDRIAQPIVAGIHAAEPDTMSLAASFPRFLDMERQHRSLILAAKKSARHPSPESGVSYFASLREGMGSLVTELVGSLGDTEIRTGVGVDRLSHDSDGYRLTLDDGTETAADAVILAIPAREASRILRTIAPVASNAISEIKQASSAVVTLGYRAADLPHLDGYGFVVPSVERRRVTGVTYSTRKWEGRSPGPELTLLRAFIGGADGQDLAIADEERLVATARAELETLAGITAIPVLRQARSWEGGFHQYTMGHLDRVIRAETALASHPGLVIAGAAFHGIGLNECVASGREAAAAARGTLGLGRMLQLDRRHHLRYQVTDEHS